MYQQLVLDLSTATGRSKGQALRWQQPALSEVDRKARRQLARKKRLELKRQKGVTQQWEERPPPSASAASSRKPQFHVMPEEFKDKSFYDQRQNAALEPSRPTFTVLTTDKQPSDLRTYGQACRYLLKQQGQPIGAESKKSTPNTVNDCSTSQEDREAASESEIEGITRSASTDRATLSFSAAQEQASHAARSDASTSKNTSAPRTRTGRLINRPANKPGSRTPTIWPHKSLKIHRTLSESTSTRMCYLCDGFLWGNCDPFEEVVHHLHFEHTVSPIQLHSISLVALQISPYSTATCWICCERFHNNSDFYDHYDCCVLNGLKQLGESITLDQEARVLGRLNEPARTTYLCSLQSLVQVNYHDILDFLRTPRIYLAPSDVLLKS